MDLNQTNGVSSENDGTKCMYFILIWYIQYLVLSDEHYLPPIN